MKMNISAQTFTILALLILSAAPLSAEQFGLFTYRVDGEEVQITDYAEDAAGEVVIPAEIDGKPVTSIGRRAFSDCSRLIEISIPERVEFIGEHSFSGCAALTSISVKEGMDLCWG